MTVAQRPHFHEPLLATQCGPMYPWQAVQQSASRRSTRLSGSGASGERMTPTGMAWPRSWPLEAAEAVGSSRDVKAIDAAAESAVLPAPSRSIVLCVCRKGRDYGRKTSGGSPTAPPAGAQHAPDRPPSRVAAKWSSLVISSSGQVSLTPETSRTASRFKKRVW